MHPHYSWMAGSTTDQSFNGMSFKDFRWWTWPATAKSPENLSLQRLRLREPNLTQEPPFFIGKLKKTFYEWRYSAPDYIKDATWSVGKLREKNEKQWLLDYLATLGVTLYAWQIMQLVAFADSIGGLHVFCTSHSLKTPNSGSQLELRRAAAAIQANAEAPKWCWKGNLP